MRQALTVVLLGLFASACTGRYVSRGEFQAMLAEQAAKHTETRQLVNGLAQQVATIEANQRAIRSELQGLNVELQTLNSQMSTLLAVLIETPVPRREPDPFRRSEGGGP
jgi:septal ring factor EnvC (AmiA/AmiB activator)